ncbi:hypothetical protein BDR07DRAFT_1443937, partial [Suillus spraguei]
LWAFVKVIRALRWRLRRLNSVVHLVPACIWVSNDLLSSKDNAIIKIVLSDPRAIAHFYARESWTYVQRPLLSSDREHSERILWSQGESQR